ncbi:hypothetical protein ASC77_08780 [Nocardioides sp. Root1257]|uniref:DUF6752 domain-containing protein n=1 Tax=unclassified Nocardioides TaxID=2615069 RepID=UPI0006F719B3|nr:MULTISPECIES: DUF6752 domain-containing protein [unclassified Nocardioides]KQW48817.1 hypothetical protein ASC77_08780 [Nocardioides sp. Root1257]KRC47992.1 hypothetical protein ASE24_08785 [Nocardioides sp. Root224]
MTTFTRTRARARIAQDRYRRLRRRPIGVRARLAVLEEELQESRQLNRRITELVDVVAELLVLVDDRDEERVREVLAQYRASI